MNLKTLVRHRLNRFLRPLNLRLDTLTYDQKETARLLRAAERGQFAEAQFPVDVRFASAMADPIAEDVRSHRRVFESWRDPASNPTGFTLSNEYFGSPDAQVLYAMVRRFKPKRIIEVGSGNSTKVMRMAIADGGLSCEIVSIDPSPRTDVASSADRVMRTTVESLRAEEIVEQLQSGDLLFIDSSHEIRTAGDVPFLYLQVLPRLHRGVVVHIHDIFYPYEYPREWVIENGWRWNEQYLLAAIVMQNPSIEILWAGHYLQRTRPELLPEFAFGRASSFWMRDGRERG